MWRIGGGEEEVERGKPKVDTFVHSFRRTWFVIFPILSFFALSNAHLTFLPLSCRRSRCAINSRHEWFGRGAEYKAGDERGKPIGIFFMVCPHEPVLYVYIVQRLSHLMFLPLCCCRSRCDERLTHRVGRVGAE